MTPSQHRDVYVWQLVQVFREYVDFPGHGAPHATHGLFGSLRPSVTCRGDSAAAAEWTQLTSTNNINAFVKITEHLYSIFARNINLASRYCDESLCERRIVSPKRNISKHVNHMRYNKN